MSNLHDDFPSHAQAREEAMLAEKAQARAELRDRFAMAALAGLLANPAEARISPAEWTYDAYRFADAMLKARGDE